MTPVRIWGSLLVIWVLTGCAGHWDLTIEKAQTITPGKTTKAELLQLFGPYPNRLGPEDPAYTLFPQSSENDRVYLFDSEKSHTRPLPLIIYIGVSTEIRTDRLWALVNESTGVVEDYAFKQYGKAVIYGRPRSPLPPDRIEKEKSTTNPAVRN
jgi:hypothetical protein